MEVNLVTLVRESLMGPLYSPNLSNLSLVARSSWLGMISLTGASSSVRFQAIVTITLIASGSCLGLLCASTLAGIPIAL
jgi:hypothetical protein